MKRLPSLGKISGGCEAAAYQAARLRPVVVFSDTLLFRFSLLWTAEIPRSKIAAVEPIKTMPEDKTILRAVFGDEPEKLQAALR